MKFITFADIEAKREQEAYLAMAHKIPKLPGVEGVYLTIGAHDIVIIHEADSLKEGVQLAIKIRSMPGIIDAETTVCLDIEKIFER